MECPGGPDFLGGARGLTGPRWTLDHAAGGRHMLIPPTQLPLAPVPPGEGPPVPGHRHE